MSGKKGSMRDVLTGADPTQQQGSLTGTLAPAPSMQGVVKAPASPVAAAAPNPAVQGPSAAPQSSDQRPDYHALDQYEPMSQEEWADLLNNLGQAIHKASPGIEASLKELSGPGIDYEKEAEPLRKIIEARQTPNPPSFAQSWLGRAGGPVGEKRIDELNTVARNEADKKQADLEKMHTDMLDKHVGELQQKGKYREALFMSLLNSGMKRSQAREEDAAKLQREELRGENMKNQVIARARAIADNFHLDDKIKLELIKRAGILADKQSAPYTQSDRLTGGLYFPDKDTRDKAFDQILSNLYDEADRLKRGHQPTAAPSQKPQTAGAATQAAKSKVEEWAARRAAGKTAQK